MPKSICSWWPGCGLEANGGRRLGQNFVAQVRDGSLDCAQAHREAVLALQLLAQDVAVATVLAEPLGQPVPVHRQPARPLRGLIGLPAALASPVTR